MRMKFAVCSGAFAKSSDAMMRPCDVVMSA
jgi:hypothetical protein